MGIVISVITLDSRTLVRTRRVENQASTDLRAVLSTFLVRTAGYRQLSPLNYTQISRCTLRSSSWTQTNTAARGSKQKSRRRSSQVMTAGTSTKTERSRSLSPWRSRGSTRRAASVQVCRASCPQMRHGSGRAEDVGEVEDRAKHAHVMFFHQSINQSIDTGGIPVTHGILIATKRTTCTSAALLIELD